MSETFFPAHGEHQVKVRGHCIEIQLIGAYNAEGALAVFSTMQRLVDKHYGGIEPWAALIDQRKFELATPDVADVVEQIYTWNIDHGQRFEAVVVPGTWQAQQSKELVDSFGKSLQWKNFKDMESAEAWLHQHAMFD